MTEPVLTVENLRVSFATFAGEVQAVRDVSFVLNRGEVLAIKAREFVQAAIVAGQRDMPILLGQVLPNALSPLIVTGSLLVANAILIESALSFLGLGAPDLMSWGFQIGAGRPFLRDAWWLVTVPGVAILFTVLAINLLGEGLNDALNPRLRDL